MSDTTFKKLSEAQEQYEQAIQNFNLADKHHVDKSIRELTSAQDRFLFMLVYVLMEVKQK